MPTQTPADYSVTVTKDYLVFCSGHFVTYENGHQCETLHGHNYKVAVSLFGSLDTDSYVFDFVTLKRLMRKLVDELDHRLLLPSDNPHLSLAEEGENISVTYKEKRYSFPRSDVVLLPIENTTAELLARYLASRLKEAAVLSQLEGIRSLEMEVEESFGQSATYREQVR